MKRTFVMSALAGAFALGLATAAFAVTGEFNNMCTEGLANSKEVKTDCSVNANIKGKTYCFSNEQAKDRKSTRLNSSHSGESRMPSSA